MVTMKRHEWWRRQYRQRRDLDHLSSEELSERLHDCINNIRTRTERGKLGLLPVGTKSGETWMILFTEVLEECNLRGYSYPGPISIVEHRSALDHAFDPIPDMDRVLDSYGLKKKPYLLKFGDPKWLRQSLEQGRFRVAPASYYDSQEHNHARRDTELHRYVRLNPRNPDCQDSTTIGNSTDTEPMGVWSRISSPSDYFLFCFSSMYAARLFGDFNSTACLIIVDPESFLARICNAISERLPGWHIEMPRVAYYDPVRVDPSSIVVTRFKPFRHAYQKEVRLVCAPPHPVSKLNPIEIEVGALCDHAILVDLSSHPPPPIPHDSKDEPIQIYGNAKEDLNMINHLPDAEQVQGILLNKTGHSHREWYFQIQYTDEADNWHELKIPMLDGLHLLNLLRTAEKEQNLGFWNRNNG